MASADVRAAFEAARRDRPELARTIDLYLALADTCRAAPAGVPGEFPAAASARLREGRPAIDPAALHLDWAAVARALSDVCEVVARHDPACATPARALGGVVGPDPTGVNAARTMALRFLQGEDPVDLGPEVGADFAAFVVTHALRPFLRPLVEAVLATREAGRWAGGRCPACGGPPDLAVLDGEGGARRLLCARCDAVWAYRRAGCPSCENDDPKTFAYYPAGDGAHRLYVCDRCRAYLKTLDLREAFRTAPLPVERVLTVGLDLAAARAGYGAARAAAR